MPNLYPVPINSNPVNENGFFSQIWSDWFQRVYDLVNPASKTWDFSNSSSGYQVLPSGLIIAWGVTSSLSSNSTTTVSFSKAFPNGCMQVMAGIRDNSGGSTASTGHVGTGNYSASSFDLYNKTSASYLFNYLAVGY